MSRRGGGTLAIFVIGALSLLVAGSLLLFVDDEESARKRQEERLARREEAEQTGAPLPADLQAGPVVVEEGPDSDPEVSIPSGFAVEGRAEIEGGFGLHAVTFLDMEGYDDGDYGAWLEAGPNDDVETGEDGRVTLRWTHGDAPVMFMALREDFEFARVENATLLRSDDLGVVFSVERGAGKPFRVIFRDPEGHLNLRLKDGRTGKVLRFEDDLQLVWKGRVSFPGNEAHAAGEQVVSWDRFVSTHSGGWVAVRTRPGVEHSVEIRAPGYLSRTVSVSDLRARTEISLDAATGFVRGKLDYETVGVSRSEPHIVSRLRPTVSGAADASGVHGLPHEPGEFTLWEVPPGSWTLDVAAHIGGRRRFASVEFQHDGTELDLGAVRVDDWSGLRLRLYDADGKPAGGVQLIIAPQSIDPDGVVPDGDSMVIEYNSIFRVKTDEKGLLELGDLRPDTDYRVLVERSRETTLDFRSPSRTGAWIDRELRWKGRMVKCRFRVTVKGELPKLWGTPMNGPWPRDTSWQKDNSPLEVSLPPGRHSFTIMASMGGTRTFMIYRATVEVPDEPTFETELRME